MWLFTSGGFLSAVRDKKDPEGDRLLVRSRDRKSLEIFLESVELAGNAAAEDGKDIERITADDIVEGEGTDYRYRVRMHRGTFALGVTFEILNFLQYGNFKDELTRSRGKTFHDAAMSVWVDMLAVDDKPFERSRPVHRILDGWDDVEPGDDELLALEGVAEALEESESPTL